MCLLCVCRGPSRITGCQVWAAQLCWMLPVVFWRLSQHLFFVCLFSPWQGKNFQAHCFMNQRLGPEREASECPTRAGATRASCQPAASQAHTSSAIGRTGRQGLLLMSDLPHGTIAHLAFPRPRGWGHGSGEPQMDADVPSEITVFVQYRPLQELYQGLDEGGAVQNTNPFT